MTAQTPSTPPFSLCFADIGRAGVSCITLLLFWTAILGGLGFWHYTAANRAFTEHARTAARYSLQKDMTYRTWASTHGRLYVPATEENPPSEFLEHVPERDVLTPSGLLLTQLHPNEMIRQVHELPNPDVTIISRLTSLDPLRPEAAPDAWETEALTRFQQGASEWSSLTSRDGQPYLRLMQPLLVEQSCLGCHTTQNYAIGDLLGGISVAIPWLPYREALRQTIPALAFGYSGVWLLGLVFIYRHRQRLVTYLTAQQQAQEALAQQARDLKQRNMEMERFNYTVSHDLKTPLVTIETFLGFLQADLKNQDAPAIDKDIGYIRSATAHMADLLDSLLHMAKTGHISDTPEQMTFNQLLADVLTLLAGNLSTDGIHIDLSDNELCLFGDRARLIEVWQNLIDNAIKYRGEQPRTIIEVGAEQQNGETVFYVRDNGIGIDPNYRENIFGLFNQLNKNSPGSGLGLALVKRIVEIYGGRIWVESQGPGTGSCFYFTLPDAINEES